MAITSKNLYKVGSVNQTKKLIGVVGYNRNFELEALEQLVIDENVPLNSKKSVLDAIIKFGGDPTDKNAYDPADKVSAYELTKQGASIFEIGASFLGYESTPDADIRIVRGEFYETASTSEENEVRYNTSEKNTLPPIKMTIGEQKPIQIADANIDVDDLSTVDWRLGALTLAAAFFIHPAMLVIVPAYSLFKTIWQDAVTTINTEDISRFPIFMEPDDTSLGLSNSQSASRVPYTTGDIFGADASDTSGKRFFLTYKPFNLDIAKLVGATKIVIPIEGPATGQNPFANFTQDDVDLTLNNFFGQVFKLAKTTSHAQLQAACQLYLKAGNIKRAENKLFESLKALVDARFDLAGADPERQEFIAENIELIKDGIKRFWISTIVVERFLNQLNDQLKSIYDPSSIEANIEKSTTMGVFFNKYGTYFNEYYKLIPPSKSRKKKSTDKKLKEEADKAIENSTTNVTDNLAQQERDFNRLQAESQIIRITGTGVNKFNHPDFANTMSILDILRDEQAHPSFEKSIAVEETSGAQTASTTDSATACSNALKSIPKTTRQLMKKALLAKKGQYLKKMFKELFSLKRLQNDPSFKVMGFFSGFAGINFAQFSSLSFDVGDFDAAKFSESFGFPGLKSQMGAIKGIIKDLTPLNIGNKYLAQINAAAGIFGAADVAVSTYLSKFAGIGDVRRHLKNVSPEDLKNCPELSSAKSTIQNDENSTNIVLDKQKDGLNATLNNFISCTSNIDKLNTKIAAIGSQTELMDLDVSDSNQIISSIPLQKQKGSRFDLGTNLSDDIANVNIDIPFTQTVPTLEP